MSKQLLIAVALLGATACGERSPIVQRNAEAKETRLSNLRQLTFGGENAEAYWSPDGEWITFQSTRDGRTCDQQFVVRADGTGLRQVSDGRGKTTCGWFFPGGERLFFASTSAHDEACPVRPDPSQGYVWPLDRYDIYTVNRDGSDLRRLTNYDIYTAEGILSPDGSKIVFTSLKDGDLDIYTMNADGTDVRRLTTTPGYDGGPWWSPDGTKIVYRAHHPKDSTELREYQDLLRQGLIRPSKVELWVMDADGGNQRQITALGGANFGPSWSPDGTKIIFSSNFFAPRSGNFELFLVSADASMAGPDQLEQVTFNDSFDGFPIFHPKGHQLLWASNRHGSTQGETNLFVADFRW
ncbi:MAG: PD40 domain-containing protein [Gemmatimonadaceae bacterium]|nr:PD40 domain-containing protein [Gemmatimonadaceae bacterium]MCW5827050.1 PD40 domain-containing protein [Gemmatimonadaceae bacterium]